QAQHPRSVYSALPDMETTDWIFIIGLPVLVLLLMGPGMWSENWGWGVLDRFTRLFRRKNREKPKDPDR
ncbi:MAG: hypothetical protein ACJ787_17365, partial [Myxococcales bacterium]